MFDQFLVSTLLTSVVVRLTSAMGLHSWRSCFVIPVGLKSITLEWKTPFGVSTATFFALLQRVASCLTRPVYCLFPELALNDAVIVWWLQVR